MTYTEECNVVADEVMHHANFLWGLSLSLEQAGGEDGGQFFARHVVDVGTLLDPESRGQDMFRKRRRKKKKLSISHAHTFSTLTGFFFFFKKCEASVQIQQRGQ